MYLVIFREDEINKINISKLITKHFIHIQQTVKIMPNVS